MGEVETNHTINSPIAKDVLQALTLADNPNEWYLGGGMSVQARLPISLHRPTRDLDLTFNRPIRYAQLQELFAEACAKLECQGYTIEYEKASQTIGFHVRGQDAAIDVQARRQNPNNYERNKNRNEQENARAEVMRLDETEFRVIGLEDILARKTLRIRTFQEKYALEPTPWSYDLDRQLTAILDFRKPLLRELQRSPDQKAAPTVQRLISIIRMQADLFDVMALLRLAKPDGTRLESAIRCYDTLALNAAYAYGLFTQLQFPREDALPDSYFTTHNI